VGHRLLTVKRRLLVARQRLFGPATLGLVAGQAERALVVR
jgi:hypothetical protein